MKYIIFLFALFIAQRQTVNAQYKGGSGKGNTVAVFSNASLGFNFFKGGPDDGVTFSLGSNKPLGRNIFLGGVNDGHSVGLAANQSLGRNIFLGGSNDGVALALSSNQPIGRNIFLGGANDGISVGVAGNQNLGRNISLGGANDGWAMAMGNAKLNAPLPVVLTDFSGRWQQTDALLSWISAAEINSSHFELERSFDGNSFTRITTKAAAGQSSVPLNYQYIDTAVKGLLPVGATAVYYRLRSVDKDARATYSGVVVLRADRGSLTQYSIYPNPARNVITIATTDLTVPGNSVVRLTDVGGRLLKQQLMVNRQQQVDVSALPDGTYFLQIAAAGKLVYTQKIIIHK